MEYLNIVIIDVIIATIVFIIMRCLPYVKNIPTKDLLSSFKIHLGNFASIYDVLDISFRFNLGFNLFVLFILTKFGINYMLVKLAAMIPVEPIFEKLNGEGKEMLKEE